MARMQTQIIGMAAALSFVAGMALAQGGLLGPVDNEMKAARQSLQDAMAHLQRSRNSGTAANARAQAFIALAVSELDPTDGSLAPPRPAPPVIPAPPPRPQR